MFIKLKEGLTINSEEISSYEYDRMKQTVITMKSVYFSGDFGTTNLDICINGDITDKLDKLLKAIDINYEHKQCPIIVENLKGVSELLELDNETEKEVLQKGELKEFYISECEKMEDYEIIQNILFELGYKWIDNHRCNNIIFNPKKENEEDFLRDIGYEKEDTGLTFDWCMEAINKVEKSRVYTPQEFLELHKHLLDKE